MTTTTHHTFDIKLPRKHFDDWVGRDLADAEGFLVQTLIDGDRYVTVRFNRHALEEFISDSIYYAQEMDPANTGDIDYRPAARRALAWIEKAGIMYTRRGFSITVVVD